MSRVPIRLRIAAAFACAMAIVLAATGLFVYARLGADLARALDQDLQLRAQDLATVVQDPGNSLAAETHARLIERGESFAQLLDRRAQVLDATRQLRGAALLTPAQIAATMKRGPRFYDRPSVPGLNEPARVLAVTVQQGRQRLVLVTGATRENRAEALRSLRTELLVAGPIALLLATSLGYLLAGTGLRTVEVMRRRAAAISAERAHERLPVPRSGDELQHLGETLNAMLARLDHALERERGFVAEAGHELRTPLALLRAELDYALHYADSEDELRAALRNASAETDRLVQLSGDLLLIASSDQGRLPLRLEPVGVRELLDSVRERFAWRAGDERRQLRAEAPADLVVEADRLRLEQALGNLLENALRYGAGQITLRAVALADSLELHVLDEGAGFEPDFLPRAFERFSRSEASRAGEGAGLGLTIVATIARAHGGVASARNQPGAGADVSLRLPLRATMLADDAPASQSALQPG